MESRATSIQVLNPNDQGNDYIIADLHANFDCYQEVIKKLTPNDRLFIAGDIVDRDTLVTNKNGSSVKLIEAIMNDPRIFMVRGNHEQVTLLAILELEKFVIANKDNLNFEDVEDNEVIAFHQKTLKGEWLVDLFMDEWREERISVTKEGKIFYGDNSKVESIKNFINSLPYIILVQGNIPFYVVHADMPVSDVTLKQLIANNAELSDQDKAHATDARPNQFKFNVRQRNSVIAYTGHNTIFDFPTLVRANQNIICGDLACFVTNVIVLINHTQGEAKLIGEILLNDAEIQNRIGNAVGKINQHLHESRTLKPSNETLSKQSTFKKPREEEKENREEKPKSKIPRTSSSDDI